MLYSNDVSIIQTLAELDKRIECAERDLQVLKVLQLKVLDHGLSFVAEYSEKKEV